MSDLIIIGAGPAGLTAGLYAARRRLETVILEGLAAGGQLAWVGRIENYPGFPEGIDGPDLAARMRQQAEAAGAAITAGQVTGIRKEGEGDFFVLVGEERRAKAVIVASGSQPKKLGVPGETELVGRGVSYCATCDGPFFREKVVAVVGGGGPAVHEALFLTRFASRVVLIHRAPAPSASAALKEKLSAEKKVETVADSEVVSISGEQKVSGVRLRDVKTGAESDLALDGVFIFDGFQPGTGFLPAGVEISGPGHIVTGEEMQTSVPGIFACGDCRRKALRQVVTACAEGAVAALSAHRYLERLKP